MASKKNKKSKAKLQENMSFWDHLDVLRYALMRSIAVIFVLAFVAFYFTDIVYSKVILGPKSADFITNILFCDFSKITGIESLCINQENYIMHSFEMAGQFKNNILICLVAGLIVGMPYLLSEMWLFIRPALTIKERKGVRGFVFITSFLFTLGVSFGYFLIAPLAVNFLINWTLSPDIINTIRLGSYIRMVVMISLSTGIVFQLPVLIYFLSKMGIVTPKLLKRFRKHAIVVFFVLSAIITPPDIFSQFLVAFPLIFLYEISIRISKRVENKKEKEL